MLQSENPRIASFPLLIACLCDAFDDYSVMNFAYEFPSLWLALFSMMMNSDSEALATVVIDMFF